MTHDLERQARQSDAQPWRPEDVFATSPVLFPWDFSPDAREKFDRLLERGDEDAAAVMVVRAAYRYFADRDQDRDRNAGKR